MKIATGNDLFGYRDHLEQHRWLLSRGSVKQRMKQLSIRGEQIGSPDAPDTSATKAAAYVNHGRWVADCPSEFCNGAVAVTPGQPFLCGSCLNIDIGCRYRMIEWPHERGAIEAALSERPVPEVANWLPGETARDLRNENAGRMMRPE